MQFSSWAHHITCCVLASCLRCLPHGIVWKVKGDYVDVLCERLDPLQGAGGRTGQVKEEGWRSVHLQRSCFPREGLAEAGRQVCFSCPDGLGHMQTRFPSRQTARPTDGHRVIHLVIVIHSSCRLRPEAVGGHFHLNFISPLTLPP